MAQIKCEHCGDVPIQKCADCKAQFDISEPPVRAVVPYTETCPICRGLRPAGCPGCIGGDNVGSALRVVSGEKEYKLGSPYIHGCIARVGDQAFLSNPEPRDTLARQQWFHGWLDTNDRLMGTVNPEFTCPCHTLTPADARILELLRL